MKNWLLNNGDGAMIVTHQPGHFASAAVCSPLDIIADNLRGYLYLALFGYCHAVAFERDDLIFLIDIER